MRSILVLNPKGGCGKSTLAINIAGYFALQGRRVALADCDPQGSCKDWLAIRPDSAAVIQYASLRADKLKVPGKTDILVIDTPAAPAPIDTEPSAARWSAMTGQALVDPNGVIVPLA